MISTLLCYASQALLYYYIAAIAILVVRRTVFAKIGQGRDEKLREKTLMVVFGSGGHTTEMLLMLTKQNAFDFSRYHQVQFVIGHSDTWSLTKIKDYFSRGSKDFDVTRDVPNLRIEHLFRSREVKQSYVTSIGTTLLALVHSVWIVAKCRPDIVITNGPGTAVPLCYAHLGLSKLLLWNTSAKILFIESFCRVTSLSLSGKLLYPIADRFIVHWEELKKGHPRAILFKVKII